MRSRHTTRNGIPIDPVLLEADKRAWQAAAAPSSAPATQRKPQNSWTDSDEKKMMAMAVEKFSGTGDNENFGKPFWTSVAADLNQQLTKGAPKDADSCKSKYNKLKLVYNTVHEIIQNSGWAWTMSMGLVSVPQTKGHGMPMSRKTQGCSVLQCGMHNVFRPAFQPTVEFQTPEDDDNWDGHSVDWNLEKMTEQEPGERSDGESNKENKKAPKTPPAAGSRKRAAPDSAAGTAKKSRSSLTSASALHDVAGGISDFNDIFRIAFAPSTVSAEIPPTPAHLESAIERAQKLETWLDKPKLVELLEVLEDKKSAVDVYNSLDDEDLRIMWVKRKVGIL
ncbi:hypothetical protein B0H17DRAFT_1154525 [Mycena rosella]|uniref:Myb/SANT-like domain-containing protein n=1 Tax=Mycena rosella TaxID=1033263 RepID=A0AAD7AYF7_MYCRO|nr:hypothetical protein B0H17DRAFT_1154525 [Mycena rosella]